MQAVLKMLAESMLLHGGPATLGRRAVQGRTLILAYHNILPAGSDPGLDGSLHLTQASFARQLDVLQDSFDVIPLAQVLDPVRPDARPRVAITFDDAYRGAVRVGTHELAERGLPATYFVAPAFIGGRSFWWDVIQDSQGDGLVSSRREAALVAMAGRDEQVRQWARESGWSSREPGPDARCIDEEELRDSLDQDGMSVGSHTWGHPNLTCLSASELKEELETSLSWLKARFPGVLPWLSYPYGLESPKVQAAARAAGYVAALRVNGGWMSSSTSNSFEIPRFNVPAGLSLDGFRLRLSGMFCR